MRETTLRTLASAAIRRPPFPDPRFPPSAYYRFLEQLVAYKHPWLSVELGVCGGGGSYHLARGWVGKVIGVDIARDHEENIAFIEANCPNFEFWLTDSITAADRASKLKHRVGILFIDTVHTFEQTLEEWDAWKDILSPDAVVCFDDLFRPGMQAAWDVIPPPKVRLDMLHTGATNGGGFGVKYFERM